MPKFKVKSPIQMGQRYEPGSVIELSDEQAAAMPWAVEATQKLEVRTEKEGEKQVASELAPSKKEEPKK